MTKDELHKYIEESKGNENNICQICAYKDGQMVYSDTWHDYKPAVMDRVDFIREHIEPFISEMRSL